MNILPTIVDVESSRRIARWGVIAAALIAAITAGITLFNMGGKPIGRLPLAEFLDSVDGLFNAFIYVVIAFGIGLMSRTAAVAGLVLFVFEKAVSWYFVEPNTIALGIAILISLAFINSVRGTFKYHKLKRLSDLAQNGIDPLQEFEREISGWPEEQARTGLMLIKATLNGDGQMIDKLHRELTVNQLKFVDITIRKMHKDTEIA